MYKHICPKCGEAGYSAARIERMRDSRCPSCGSLPDDYIVARLQREGVRHTPQACTECERELTGEAHGLCFVCEGKIVDEFEAFLQELSEAQLECLDRLCEGASLMDIARR